MTGASHRGILSLAAAALAALGAAGCGSGSGSGTVTKPAAATTTMAAPATAVPKAATARVAIKDFDYAPRRITVAAGTRVTWVNADATNHTVTLDAAGAGAGAGTGNIAAHGRGSLRFAKAGTFAYHCDFHPNMHGVVVVR